MDADFRLAENEMTGWGDLTEEQLAGQLYETAGDRAYVQHSQGSGAPAPEPNFVSELRFCDVSCEL